MNKLIITFGLASTLLNANSNYLSCSQQKRVVTKSTYQQSYSNNNYTKYRYSSKLTSDKNYVLVENRSGYTIYLGYYTQFELRNGITKSVSIKNLKDIFNCKYKIEKSVGTDFHNGKYIEVPKYVVSDIPNTQSATSPLLRYFFKKLVVFSCD